MFAVFRRLFGNFLGQLIDQDTASLSIAEELRQNILRVYRRRLMTGAISGRFQRRAKVARRRYARDKTQKLAKALRRGAKLPRLKKGVLLGRFTPSPILDALVADRGKRWVPVMKRDRTTPIEIELKNFSILEHPGDTIKAIKHLAEVACVAIDAQLHFDDTYCTDIGSYLVLAEVWPAMSHVFRGGRIRLPIQKVIDAVRMRSALAMRFPVEPNSSSDVWAFPLHRRRPSKISKSIERNLAPQTREKVADGFCNAVDGWLGITADLELTEEGKSKFASLIGELLDNAERHSELSKDGSWSIAAFMARRKEDGEDVYRCYMAFLSEGISIAEGLRTAAPSIQDEVDQYCSRHQGSGQSRETLATLMALQDTITRDAAATAGSRGGIGFQDVLEFVNTFGATEIESRGPRFTIISGKSCIQLRPPYITGSKAGPTEPRLLWCNQSNSPVVPPEKDFVFDIEDHFAGTIVSLSFVLDSENLRKSINA
jgi:hypothetical protein